MLRKNSYGFSIPELLVVIVTIAILASIVIVSYNGIQNRGYDASIRSDLDGFAGLVEAYRQRSDGTNDAHRYPIDPGTLAPLNIKVSKAAYSTSANYNLIYCVSGSSTPAYTDYRLITLSKSGNIFVQGPDGLVQHSLTSASFTLTVCNSAFGMSIAAFGFSGPNTWQSWVGSN